MPICSKIACFQELGSLDAYYQKVIHEATLVLLGLHMVHLRNLKEADTDAIACLPSTKGTTKLTYYKVPNQRTYKIADVDIKVSCLKVQTGLIIKR